MKTRPIKFRIWDLQAKRFVDNDCGTHCCSNWMIDAFTGEVCNMVQSIGHEGFTRSEDYGCFDGKKHHKKRYVSQQFTGIKIGGKPLYEGDIVKVEAVGWLYQVKWNTCGFELVSDKRSDWGPITTSMVGMSKKKIVGNIFENPELLQKK